MNIEYLREYCLSKKGVTEDLPFDDNVLVFKVMGKVFLLTGLDTWENTSSSINLKCDPEYALELREQYESIYGGYHMNKKHWNTLDIYKNELPPKLILELIDHSYDMVVKGMTKKMKEALTNL